MGEMGHELCRERRAGRKDRWTQIPVVYNQIRGTGCGVGVIFPALGEQMGTHLPPVWDHRGRVLANSIAGSPLQLLPASGQVLGFVPHQVQDSASHLLLKCAPVPTNAQAAGKGRGHATESVGGPSDPICLTPGPATHPRSLSKSLGR